ncbi:unnamed protein product [Linum trigynum]|uniref:Uncharacterized protein n=1 Tax=Linum trigynum TaxID=586398 RepID=A0AAV2D5L6_9ROSI
MSRHVDRNSSRNDEKSPLPLPERGTLPVTVSRPSPSSSSSSTSNRSNNNNHKSNTTSSSVQDDCNETCNDQTCASTYPNMCDGQDSDYCWVGCSCQDYACHCFCLL